MIKHVNKQQGVALIVVLLIVAVVAVIAIDITSRNQLAVRRTLNLAQYDQAYWYALSAEELAKKVIKQDLDDAEGKKVHLQQYWAQADVLFPVENGQISGTITDMRACFNINGLNAKVADAGNSNNQNPKKLPLAGEQFAGLLIALGMEPFTAEALAVSLKDYISSSSASGGFSSGDAAYESRDVPYRAAKTVMNHRSELRAVLGFTQEAYLKLVPYICAIPGNNRQLLNVNTIKVEQAPLLAGMLQNKVSVGEAESIINQRPANGYDSIDDFWNISELSALKNDNLLKSSFAVKSEYFLLDGGAKVDEAIFRLESVLQVAKNNYVDVLTRQYGGQK
ncbi:general secretion pathway protein GspK [Parashewanella spongiae]|uniref:Type II secretion system protein K n=1 Tax=Parashewanella spongiae TaxID=342950 RepID=A0A3A6UM94_9GAMM|nr:type II secretion system minor pseudopilin GspK [Parashewanella spongiae]MCL1077153.1 type II secretion system minor pseudopilin GspK [Parashewanella spongiae]RJY18824.1 general secretion pathway protein GspK [Parashewanella spongiae]